MNGLYAYADMWASTFSKRRCSYYPFLGIVMNLTFAALPAEQAGESFNDGCKDNKLEDGVDSGVPAESEGPCGIEIIKV